MDHARLCVKVTLRGWPRWRDRFPQYGIKVSYWGSGTLKIVIPVENHPHPNVWLLSTSTFYFYFYFLFRFSGAAGSDALQCLMHLTAFRFSGAARTLGTFFHLFYVSAVTGLHCIWFDVFDFVASCNGWVSGAAGATSVVLGHLGPGCVFE